MLLPNTDLRSQDQQARPTTEPFTLPPPAAIAGQPETQLRLLEQYLSNQQGDYVCYLADVAKTLGPLRPSTVISAGIPVAAHEESRHIGRGLACFHNQTLSPDFFEIVIFLNFPVHAANNSEAAVRKTARCVGSWDRRGLDLRSFTQGMAAPVSIGHVRRILTDVTVLRAVEAKRPDLLLLRMDADNAALHPLMLESHLRAFRTIPKVIGIRGRIDYDYPSLLRDPLTLFGWRAFQVISALEARQVHQPPSGGPNFSTPAYLYAMAGGYDPGATVGEDVIMGQSLMEVCGHLGQLRKLGSQSTVWTAGRRACAATNRGWSPAMQWSVPCTAFGDENRLIRSEIHSTFDMNRFLAFLRPEIFLTDASETFTETLDLFVPEEGERRRLFARRAASIMGFRMENSGERPQITEWNALRTWLVSFASSAPSRWAEITRGLPPYET